MKLHCLVVEDEPLSQDVITGYIQDCPNLELVRVCSDALEAGEIMQNHRVDLLFLDINLPRLSGLRFLKTLSAPPLVIFTTAYPEFAVEGFEADAVDYLVKPFSFDRFLKAVNKALEKTHFLIGKSERHFKDFTLLPEYILLRSEKKDYRINFTDIEYIEAIGDYLKVFTGDKFLVVHDTIKEMLDKLPSSVFIRVHKSFIISLDKIKYIEGNRIRTTSTYIPIGKVYKEELVERLKIDKGW
jgi:DNA-binding LytR/AlgR family response regulator